MNFEGLQLCTVLKVLVWIVIIIDLIGKNNNIYLTVGHCKKFQLKQNKLSHCHVQFYSKVLAAQ